MNEVNAIHGALDQGRISEGLSALADGEVSEQELDALLVAFGEHEDARSCWHRYQVIGDVLRGSAPPVTGRPSGDFLASLRTRLQDDCVDREPVLAVKASVPLELPSRPDADLSLRPSANDPVFRWKMVAGFASLAAVMAVSWGLMGAQTPAATGPQLAGSGAVPATQVSLAASAPAPTTPAPLVVVPTGQGPVIRDPQLEALMAEHRQHGGMSALQMPAGFLRNATFDAPPR